MAIRALRHLPDDPVLRQKARRVPTIDSSIQQLIDDMVETMQQTKGVGLAAHIHSLAQQWRLALGARLGSTVHSFAPLLVILGS